MSGRSSTTTGTRARVTVWHSQLIAALGVLKITLREMLLAQASDCHTGVACHGTKERETDGGEDEAEVRRAIGAVKTRPVVHDMLWSFGWSKCAPG